MSVTEHINNILTSSAQNIHEFSARIRKKAEGAGYGRAPKARAEGARLNYGAIGAEGVEWVRGCPLPTGGSGEGAVLIWKW